MTRPTDPLFDQRIADWLEADPDHAPAQALDIVLAAVPSVRQRRQAPWRFRPMTMPSRLATAILVGALVLGGALLLTGGGSRPSTAIPTPTSPAPAWISTSAMSAGRVNFTATVLADGKVLAAGGRADGADLASAELFDPATNKWTATASMHAARSYHTATRLRDGRVLVVGNGSEGSTSGELFDPASGTWTGTAPMEHARGQQMAALLPDGRVLVAGGTLGDAPVAAEIFDPSSGTWTSTGTMTARRGSSSMAVLGNGKVLVAGGFAVDTQSAELFDPATGIWTATGRMATGRTDGASATLLPNGRVIVLGGDVTSITELYDPATGTWTTTGPLVTAANGSATSLFPDGRVLLAGGLGSAGDSDALSSTEIYDPASGTWTSATPLNVARISAQPALLPDGRVLVVAGSTTGAGGTSLSSSELYVPGH